MSERAPIGKRRHRTWRARLRALPRDSDAGTSIEYGLILALVVLVMFASLADLANITVSMWNDVSTKVINAH